jgi:hypothetical protein
MLRDRRTLIAVAVAVILAAAVAWAWFGPSAASPSAVATRQSGPPRRASEQQDGALPPAASVKLGSLESPKAEPADATRNPFRFERAAPKTGNPDSGEPGLVLKPAEPAAPPAPTGPPAPPPIPLKFIGMVEKADGSKLAVLVAGEGRSPMHGKEGDIIDGRYRILKIGTESIEMVYLDGRGKQTIRLTGQ